MSAKRVYLDLFKHSAVYGVGQIFARLASFLLLPVYTSYLRPTDYGAIAMLDLMGGMLATLVVSGILQAVNRYYFDAGSDEERQRVWWTGMTFVLLLATMVAGLGFVIHDELAGMLLGSDLPHGGLYVQLMLATFWFGAVRQLPGLFLRVQKKSFLFVGFSIGHLLLNIALNVYLLWIWELGVVAILLGNLLSETIHTFGLLTIFSRHLGGYAVNRSLGKQLWRFGAPLLLTGFFSLVMHQANRYVLNVFWDLTEVGLFSLAYTVGQGVNSLFLIPFELIWSVMMYEVCQRADYNHIYAKVFEYWAYGVGVIMLGVALMARPLLQIMVAPDYWPAADFIPILCLAFWLFSLHTHFKIPALLAKRTRVLMQVSLGGAVVAVLANWGLIPVFGGFGAAWASVCTFCAFSFCGLWQYRRIDRYPYPIKKISIMTVGLVGSYLGYHWLSVQGVLRGYTYFYVGALIWIAWALGLFGYPIWKEIRSRGMSVMLKDFTAAMKS